MKKKVGIMGGTFDPVHYGHLLIAEQSYQEYHLDKVIFMPAGQPPHKQKQQIADNDSRLTMLLLATQDVPYFSVSDYELQKEGLSYTYQTLIYLTETCPDTDFYFIMGADSVRDLSHWVHPEIIAAKARILAAVRGDTDLAALQQEADLLTQRYGARISLLAAPRLDISSKELRYLLSEGESVRFLLPEEVRIYIQSHGLYRS